MSKNEENKKNKKPKKEVYVLHATYNDNDPETVGVYDSMQAMMQGFAKCIVEDVTLDNPSLTKGALARVVAHELANLIPAFFDKDYPRDEEGYISCGDTTYGYDIMEVEGVEGTQEFEKEA